MIRECFQAGPGCGEEIPEQEQKPEAAETPWWAWAGLAFIVYKLVKG